MGGCDLEFHIVHVNIFSCYFIHVEQKCAKLTFTSSFLCLEPASISLLILLRKFLLIERCHLSSIDVTCLVGAPSLLLSLLSNISLPLCPCAVIWRMHWWTWTTVIRWHETTCPPCWPRSDPSSLPSCSRIPTARSARGHGAWWWCCRVLSTTSPSFKVWCRGVSFLTRYRSWVQFCHESAESNKDYFISL